MLVLGQFAVSATEPSWFSSSPSSVTVASQNPQTSNNGNVCRKYSPEELLKTMQKNGFYNSHYMAKDIETAAQHFPDLTDQQFITAETNFSCDMDCDMETMRLRQLLKEEHRKAPEGNLTAFNRPHSQVLLHNSQLNVRQRWVARRRKRGERIVQKIYIVDGIPEHHRNRLGHRADRRNESKEILGNTYPIECTAAGHETAYGFQQLCGSCRSVRELPEEYFPRILNEVVCGKKLKCLNGHGKCIQKFLPIHVLKNFGSENCQDWRESEIAVRVFCDCLIDSFSPLYHKFVH